MAVTFAEGYASPMLRKGVFDRIYPGSTLQYDSVPIGKVFSSEHLEGTADHQGNAQEAIICTLSTTDGQFFVGVKEVMRREYIKKANKWEDVPQTPEQYTADCTKALGRALRDAGIPQKADELKALMQWIAQLNGAPMPTRSVNRRTGEIRGSADPDDIDSPDAGGSDDLTLEQRVAVEVQGMTGPEKVRLAQWAKSEHGVTNINRAGAKAEELMTHIIEMRGSADA